MAMKTVMYDQKTFSPAVTRLRAMDNQSSRLNHGVVGTSELLGCNGSVSTPPATMPVHTRSYTLNQVKALNNKAQATHRKNVTCQLTGGGLVIQFSTAFYEVFKAVVPVYLDNAGLSYKKSDSTDNGGSAVVQTTYAIKAEQIKQYVINLYHTKSSALVNGINLDHFMETDWPGLVSTMNNLECNGEPIDWEYMNMEIREQLASVKINRANEESSGCTKSTKVMGRLDFESRLNDSFHIESTAGSGSLSPEPVDSEPVDDITYTKERYKSTCAEKDHTLHIGRVDQADQADND